MRLVPTPHAAKISFFRSKLALWAEHAAALNLPPDAVAALADKVAAAQAAREAQFAAQEAARTATAALELALRDLDRAGAGLIQQIRATAAAAATEAEEISVYTTAQIPPPAKGSPIGQPGQPTNFTATLCPADGTLKLKWACRHPRGAVGTVYEVARQLGDAAPFVPLATVGKKCFVDATLPAGTARVMYQVTAARSTARGPVAQFSVVLGRAPAVAA